MSCLYAGRLTVLALACLPVLAIATAQRTFVSGHGTDNATCSIVAPCRAFSAAHSATTAGGEIIVLDSAGYGPVTVTKSISIVAPPGIYAGISVFANAGIRVDGSGISVVLRGLTLVGQGAIGLSGVFFTQGAKLTVQDCDISRMTNYGIYAIATDAVVSVKSTVLRENFIGFGGVGVKAVLDDVHLHDNSSTGVDAGDDTKMTVTNSVIANSGTDGFYVHAFDTHVTDVMITGSTIGRATNGIHAASAFNGTVRVVVDNCALDELVATAFLFDGGSKAIIYTMGNNRVGFNNGFFAGGTLTPLGPL